MPAPASTLHCPLGCMIRDLLVDWTQWSQKCLVAVTYAMIVRKPARLVPFLAIGIFLHMPAAPAHAHARADAESTAPNVPVHPYLGESPPGTVPKPFAAHVIHLDDSVHGSIAFHPDGTEIYWTLYPSTSTADPPMIMFVKEVEGVWTSPEKAPFCDEHGAGEISITPSGDRLYFSSRRPLPPAWGEQLRPGTREWGVGKIWFVDRVDGAWGTPRILDREINQDLNGVSSTQDGILYSSGIRRIRPDGHHYEPIEHLGPPLDILVPGGQFLGGHPFIAPDESFLLFNDHWPGHRGYGIFASFRRSDDTWTQPVNVLQELGLERGGSVPVLSYEGRYLFYYSAGGFWWVDASIIGAIGDRDRRGN